MSTKMIYRGYDVEKNKEGWTVKLEGEVQTSQPSEEFALHWIDKEKRRLQQLIDGPSAA